MAVKHPRPDLRFQPLDDQANARIGAEGSALVDYLLHPPQGAQAELGADVSHDLRRARRGALEALIRSAFDT
ncbi:hypothetical protein [Paracoccus shanxieyensis]|uniref:Uncharacterized protein n=1 Tax=Paracoccus shanxieyensis TaxID=2675752 RepID=A0A6L6IX02_9RHOB|nr:hypothetical protein [Paracoccus shanxieyensis]MTH63812.1 hypothetical protein [Paracoccus shanxieyensis]MTH86677.1 hypothetical protein [Paracoccus shanxieyensis]